MPKPEASIVEEMGLRVDCGWCKENIRNPKGDPNRISHGICKPCKREFFPATRVSAHILTHARAGA